MKTLLLALVVSVGLNTYLIATREARLRPKETKSVEPVAEPMSATARRLLVPSPSRPGSYSMLERAALEQRVLAAEAEVEKFLRPEDRYARGSRSLESEARVKPYLDAVFEKLDLPEPKYSVECHDLTCKLSADQRRTNEWALPLQSAPGRAGFGKIAFGPKGTFIELLPDEQAWLQLIYSEAGPAIRKCALANPSPAGQLVFGLATDSSRGVAPRISGVLADRPLSTCVKTALERAIARVAVPAHVQLEDSEHTVTIPFDE